jgi:CcmD family protein
MKNLGFLVAAYSAVWLVLSYFLTLLFLRNRALSAEIRQLEERLDQLEARNEATKAPANPAP